ncbi:hypothetical protein [Mammaliicoccus sciuri]|uniref:hypothetical protein n=1 Tax=Mammaliicoccus sciuri TaxID=1296 RepID=UPI002DB94FEF|nr:hypothetical protein [Mammaliicoccus sciuri]MEB8263399.1 hypothetical protein [Mammaliicoccus sciuri]
MKDKVQFVIIALLGIVAFILFFGFVLSNIDPNNKLEAYTLAISFVGIFATFGGAYLGAKIAGDNAIKLLNMQNKDKDKIVYRKIELLFRQNNAIAKTYIKTLKTEDLTEQLINIIKAQSDIILHNVNMILLSDINVETGKFIDAINISNTIWVASNNISTGITIKGISKEEILKNLVIVEKCCEKYIDNK